MKERVDRLRSRYRDEAVRRGISPRDVDLLLSDITGRPLPHLIAHGEESVDVEPLARLLARRFAGEPLQYIRGKADFYSREFLVDRRVLIPRPETEILVEAVLDRAPHAARVIDLGTGSGCIAITLERERRELRVCGADISIDALAVASANCVRLQSSVRLVGSDLLGAFRRAFDVVVSNPPYIAADDLEHLAPEVREHEPRVALTTGARGTEAIERIFDDALRLLTNDGFVALEIGYGQCDSVTQLAESRGYRVDAVIDDLAAIPRVVICSRSGPHVMPSVSEAFPAD